MTSAGQEAAELAESAGLTLDPWQRRALDVTLGERADGQWAAFEACVVVSRQNGKGSILEARELAGLYLFGEKLILHSAHEFKTAAEGFLRVRQLIENTDDLRKKVKRVMSSHGDEGIELLPRFGGGRLRFVARSRGSGRGFTGDCVILDEAYALDSDAMAALLPTLSARPNPQIWYTSSAPMASSSHLLSVRRRAVRGGEDRLAYLEWSIDPEVDRYDDPEAWAKANPALGIRITEDFVAAELAAMQDSRDKFLRERLGVPDDPDGGNDLISPAAWAGLADDGSALAAPEAWALDVNPERTWASFAVAGRRQDGLLHVEVVDRREGVAWVVERAVEFRGRWRVPLQVASGSPAAALVPALRKAGVTVEDVTAETSARWCGVLVDAVHERTVRHIDQVQLAAAVRGAVPSNRGDVWLWSRRSSDVDISPLVAVTLAHGRASAGVGDALQAVW